MTGDRRPDKPQMAEINTLHASLCSGVADPIRIALLYEISTGPKNVTDLVAALGLPQSSVSRHLRILRDRQLVTSRRQGTMVYYELADGRVIDALDLLRAMLRARLESRALLADVL
jgi:DNA-binding transcriptional ArsR family regulator